ncbi:baseplate J/gp47 family protein [Chloroflexota bacterium]
MKTQIVQLEPHDDYISVRDRMGWGQTTRVLLVWPPRGDILHRRLDLILIKRFSIALGSQLALVTRDRNVRYQADQLNIPVYRSVQEAEQSRWRRPRKRRKRSKSSPLSTPNIVRREKPDLETMREQAHPSPPRWLTHPVVRISIFTIGVLSMLVVAAIFIPSAEIYITPASKTETITIDVSASTEHKSVDLSGAVPAYVESVVVEGRGRIPATGKTSIPKQSAIGQVTFTNLTDEDISLPLGVVVSTQDEPPVRFETTREALIPTGPKGATVPIEAIQPGRVGNVSSERIIAIEGPLGLNLTTINKQRTVGGSDFTAATPSQDDYMKVYNQLFDSLAVTAQSEFEIIADPGDIPLSDSPINQQALEDSYHPELGEPADQLDLSLRAEFQFPYATGSDLDQLGRIVLDRHINEDFTPRPETLQITQLTQPVALSNGKVVWRMQASWQMGANLNVTKATSVILGLAPEQAHQQLEQLTLIEPGTEIRLTPDWWPRLPMLPFRVKIINLLDSVPIGD